MQTTLFKTPQSKKVPINILIDEEIQLLEPKKTFVKEEGLNKGISS
jgi:hypothetical protein